VARLIDTSTLVALERHDLLPRALPRIVGDPCLLMSAITASELIVGVHRTDDAIRKARRQALVERLIAEIPIIAFDLDVARVHARLLAQLTATRIAIGAHDLLIGATAVTHRAAVVTENLRDFQRIPELMVHPPLW
jgi:predicted nucleic acid-binding protein